MSIMRNVNVDRIKCLAKSQGLSLKYISNRIGKYDGFLSCVRNGTDNIDTGELDIIADILDTTPEYLKGETDDPRKKSPAQMDEGLNEHEAAVLEAYRAMNEDGKSRLLEYSGYLAEQDKYKAATSNNTQHFNIPMAAVESGAIAHSVELSEEDLEEIRRINKEIEQVYKDNQAFLKGRKTGDKK